MIFSSEYKIEKDQNYTKRDVLANYDEYSLFKTYIPNLKLGQAIKSPLRKDRNPSFVVYRGKDEYVFKDFGTNQKGNIFVFLRYLWGYSNNNEVYKQILLTENTIKKYDYHKITEEIEIRYGIVYRDWNEVDIRYWQDYGISIKLLEKFNVIPISHYLINGIVKYKHTTKNPMYAYEINGKYKIYRPLASKSYKWHGNTTSEDIQGYKLMHNYGHDILFITKSLKDVMVLFNFGYNAIAPNSETTELHNIESLLNGFRHIVILYDRDSTGEEGSSLLEAKISQIRDVTVHNMKIKETKDISDYYKAHGYEKTKEILTKFLNNN